LEYALHKAKNYFQTYAGKFPALARTTLALTQKPDDPETWIDAVERDLLGLKLTPSERALLLYACKAYRLKRWGFLASYHMLPNRVEERLYGVTGNNAHHHARVTLVKENLPHAGRILDLGGACFHDRRGALLTMGYPHKPSEIVIVDQPPAARRVERSSLNQESAPFLTESGIKIKYVYGDLCNLQQFSAETFDMVWCGQSIEHIPKEKVNPLLFDLGRVLRRGGRLCLDTPNRKLTSLLSPHSYIHPEHFYEYEPSELQSMIQSAGFTVVDLFAISPLPMSLRTARFCKLELLESTGLKKDDDSGFSFAVMALKP
jgi:SAM-dependent methyltransferase